MKKTLRFLIFLVAFLSGCTRDLFVESLSFDTHAELITQARVFSETDAAQFHLVNPDRKLTTPTEELSPDWDNAIVNEDSLITSIEVPVIGKNITKAYCAGLGSLKELPAISRLLVRKDAKVGKWCQFLVTRVFIGAIPDIEGKSILCYEGDSYVFIYDCEGRVVSQYFTLNGKKEFLYDDDIKDRKAVRSKFEYFSLTLGEKLFKLVTIKSAPHSKYFTGLCDCDLREMYPQFCGDCSGRIRNSVCISCFYPDIDDAEEFFYHIVIEAMQIYGGSHREHRAIRNCQSSTCYENSSLALFHALWSLDKQIKFDAINDFFEATDGFKDFNPSFRYHGSEVAFGFSYLYSMENFYRINSLMYSQRQRLVSNIFYSLDETCITEIVVQPYCEIHQMYKAVCFCCECCEYHGTGVCPHHDEFSCSHCGSSYCAGGCQSGGGGENPEPEICPFPKCELCGKCTGVSCSCAKCSCCQHKTCQGCGLPILPENGTRARSSNGCNHTEYCSSTGEVCDCGERHLDEATGIPKCQYTHSVMLNNLNAGFAELWRLTSKVTVGKERSGSELTNGKFLVHYGGYFFADSVKLPAVNKCTKTGDFFVQEKIGERSTKKTFTVRSTVHTHPDLPVKNKDNPSQPARLIGISDADRNMVKTYGYSYVIVDGIVFKFSAASIGDVQCPVYKRIPR